MSCQEVPLRRGDIDRFFREVGKRISLPVQVYLTGGIASWIMGGQRPTEDIDFGLKTPAGKWHEAEKIFQEISHALGIPIQFSENISRWGMIDLLNYEKSAKLYKKFGKVSVYHLDLHSWSIGKMGRYYQSDIEDMVNVFKIQKPNVRTLVKKWSEALRKSPRSSSQILFIKAVEDFLKNYGRAIWGEKFDIQKNIDQFTSSIRPSPE